MTKNIGTDQCLLKRAVGCIQEWPMDWPLGDTFTESKLQIHNVAPGPRLHTTSTHTIRHTFVDDWTLVSQFVESISTQHRMIGSAVVHHQIGMIVDEANSVNKDIRFRQTNLQGRQRLNKKRPRRVYTRCISYIAECLELKEEKHWESLMIV